MADESTYIPGFFDDAVCDGLFQALEVFLEKALVFEHHCIYSSGVRLLLQ